MNQSFGAQHFLYTLHSFQEIQVPTKSLQALFDCCFNDGIGNMTGLRFTAQSDDLGGFVASGWSPVQGRDATFYTRGHCEEMVWTKKGDSRAERVLHTPTSRGHHRLIDAPRGRRQQTSDPCAERWKQQGISDPLWWEFPWEYTSSSYGSFDGFLSVHSNATCGLSMSLAFRNGSSQLRVINFTDFRTRLIPLDTFSATCPGGFAESFSSFEATALDHMYHPTTGVSALGTATFFNPPGTGNPDIYMHWPHMGYPSRLETVHLAEAN